MVSLLQGGKYRFDARQVAKPRLGQRHGPRGASEQRDPDFLFQNGDDARRRWLRQPKFTACRRETSGAGHAAEQAQGEETVTHLRYEYIIAGSRSYCLFSNERNYTWWAVVQRPWRRRRLRRRAERPGSVVPQRQCERIENAKA